MADARVREARIDRVDVATPAWVPQSVRDVLKGKLRTLGDHGKSDTKEALALLRRLGSDLRMKKVWVELTKKRRNHYKPTDTFVRPALSVASWIPEVRYAKKHPERAPDAPPIQVLENYYALIFVESLLPKRPKSHQELALAYLFDRAYEFARTNTKVIPITGLRTRRRHFIEMAEQLRADATEQQRLGLYDNAPILGAARAYDELAEMPEPAPGKSLLVSRRRAGNAAIQVFVIRLADLTSHVFGSPLYGCVATITNVALDCEDDLTPGIVRKMLTSYPARKRA